MGLRRAFATVAVVLFAAAPARADFGSDPEADQSVLIAVLGGAVGGGLGFAGGYAAWKVSGMPDSAEEWFVTPGLVAGMLTGVVAALYAEDKLEDSDRRRQENVVR